MDCCDIRQSFAFSRSPFAEFCTLACICAYSKNILIIVVCSHACFIDGINVDKKNCSHGIASFFIFYFFFVESEQRGEIIYIVNMKATLRLHERSFGFVKKGIAGRINAAGLFASNDKLKKEALREKGYWEVNRESHPINRASYRRWEKRMEEETLFKDKASKLPVDQQFKMKKLMSVTNIAFLGPLTIIGYFIFCYFRYWFWGVTPIEGSTQLSRSLQNLSRPPV